MEYNFDNVEAASGISMTMPGTVGLFKIGKVEFGTSKQKQTPFMKLYFDCIKRRDEKGSLVPEDSSFNHSYYLSEAAMKRIQYLAKVLTDSELRGSLNETALTTFFMNKQIGLKVSGQVGDNGKGYPDLSYAGYACKASEFVNDPLMLSYNAQESASINEALEAIRDSRASNADSDKNTSSGSPDTGRTKQPF